MSKCTGDIQAFYREVDRLVSCAVKNLPGQLACARGCSSCCIDDITVFAIEAENIRAHFPALLRDGVPHTRGACAFLDDRGACRIYLQRPYVCRTQGMPLRWHEQLESGDYVEMRDICQLNEPTAIPLEELSEECCWAIGPSEAELSAMQLTAAGNRCRIGLRSLFMHPSPDTD
ncbi:MAG TPA: YkgJ family cysteine cluster protein [Dissulfurispiraceae bacterium]|nr:YkgJ family cysteine cluster protein [Dissulfurispiraceae bacterium]